jgi:hypothetical protein
MRNIQTASILRTCHVPDCQLARTRAFLFSPSLSIVSGGIRFVPAATPSLPSATSSPTLFSAMQPLVAATPVHKQYANRAVEGRRGEISDHVFVSIEKILVQNVFIGIKSGCIAASFFGTNSSCAV